MDGSINQFPEQTARDNIDKLAAYDKTVDRNFQKWMFEKQAEALKFNKEQMNWLRMMKEQLTQVFILGWKILTTHLLMRRRSRYDVSALWERNKHGY